MSASIITQTNIEPEGPLVALLNCGFRIVAKAVLLVVILPFVFVLFLPPKKRTKRRAPNRRLIAPPPGESETRSRYTLDSRDRLPSGLVRGADPTSERSALMGENSYKTDHSIIVFIGRLRQGYHIYLEIEGYD